MRTISAALIVPFLMFGALAEESRAGTALETETFKMSLPPGWKETKRDTDVLYLGFGRQTAEIRIARATGAGTTREDLRQEIVSNAANADYHVAQAVREKQAANGNLVVSAKLRTRDNDAFRHLYGVVGPGAGLLVTTEGPFSELFAANIFEYYVLTSVQWK